MKKGKTVWLLAHRWHKGAIVTRGPNLMLKRNLEHISFRPVEDGIANEWYSITPGWKHRRVWQHHLGELGKWRRARWKGFNRWVEQPAIKPFYSNAVAVAFGIGGFVLGRLYPVIKAWLIK